MRISEINPLPVMIENLHLQALLAHTHPTLLIHPKTDRIVFANQAAANLLGRSIEELLATSMSALHKGQVPSLVVFSEAAFYHGFAWTRGLDLTRPDGTELKLEHEARPLILDGEEYLTVTISDLDARHRRD
ncbi:MAG TPA: histidine kinase, partial [Thalassospira sp.]|nr:histidine kinase [Thalassospira sp.]